MQERSRPKTSCASRQRGLRGKPLERKAGRRWRERAQSCQRRGQTSASFRPVLWRQRNKESEYVDWLGAGRVINFGLSPKDIHCRRRTHASPQAPREHVLSGRCPGKRFRRAAVTSPVDMCSVGVTPSTRRDRNVSAKVGSRAGERLPAAPVLDKQRASTLHGPRQLMPPDECAARATTFWSRPSRRPPPPRTHIRTHMLRRRLRRGAAQTNAPTAIGVPLALGRSPHKNCKNDLDDQT